MLAGPPGRIVAAMGADRSRSSPESLRTFLAERYRAGTSRELARQEAEAIRAAASQLSAEGRPVTLIGSLLVPVDETVFSLFGAASSSDVAEVGERANQPYDRISEGVPITRRASRSARERSSP